ncbi:hypothetical protein OB13_10840 [Pontibacter sp. HJ8]
MEIQERPKEFSAVGGRLPNPVLYKVATSGSYVEALVLSGESEIGKLRASTRNGVAVLDVSSVLRDRIRVRPPAGLEVVEAGTGVIAYWCRFKDSEGAELTDQENVHYAVAAALPAGVSDYSGYTVL